MLSFCALCNIASGSLSTFPTSPPPFPGLSSRSISSFLETSVLWFIWPRARMSKTWSFVWFCLETLLKTGWMWRSALVSGKRPALRSPSEFLSVPRFPFLACAFLRRNFRSLYFSSAGRSPSLFSGSLPSSFWCHAVSVVSSQVSWREDPK